MQLRSAATSKPTRFDALKPANTNATRELAALAKGLYLWVPLAKASVFDFEG